MKDKHISLRLPSNLSHLTAKDNQGFSQKRKMIIIRPSKMDTLCRKFIAFLALIDFNLMSQTSASQQTSASHHSPA
uniref:Uncharacterized protein n=1 Tax=Arundo donax TaxID=35708 RepID=A0A0A9HRL6_ARUDO